MKKIFIVPLFCLFTNVLIAQTTNTFPPDGNVGIGTLIPTGKLTIAGNANNNPNTGPEVDYEGLNLTFKAEHTQGYHNLGSIKMVQPSGSFFDAGDMVFSTSYGSLAEKMRINQFGFVGIGTTPFYNLHIKIDNNFSAIQRSSTANYAGHYYMTGTNTPAIYNFFTGLRENSNDYHIYNGEMGEDAFDISMANNFVGIGTSNPNTKLDVNGAIGMQGYGFLSSQRNGLNNYTSLLLGGAIKDNGNGTFTVVGDGASNYFSAIRMDGSGGGFGAINFYSAPSNSGLSYTVTNADLANDLRMTIVNGNVGIGIANPQEKLAVNGTIHSKVVTVDLHNWPDFVFKPSYKLRPLSDVKIYIDQNHRLPEMPSATEVDKNGLNLGEVNKLLTKKVEELTLYLIEKDKELIELKELQKNGMQTLQDRIQILEQKLEKQH